MKRATAALCACFFLFFCGCEMRGNTLELDLYPADALMRTYEAIQRGDIKINYPNTETLPQIRAQILNHAGKQARIINIYVYNESVYNVNAHGYMWFVNGDTQCKGIYYNSEKKVANSTYEINLDTGFNGYFLYELLVSEPIEIAESCLAFFFFKYEDTEYVAAIDSTETILYWPKKQTLSA